MWLLPLFSTISRVAVGTYFRLGIGGERVPEEGPALLVANHPNSLLDPALVAAAARRPVRFLAKSGLFSVPVIGWLVKGAGSIPVIRRQDDPAQMDRNVDAFAAAHTALAEGSAIGIFPEGTSHDEPSLAQIRTGAARIALGAVSQVGHTFPIIPIGLVFRRKEIFRSEALVVVGEPVDWSDLASDGPTPEAVRTLTLRIEAALRRVTVNLDRWEDAPLVETAEAIYAAEFAADRSAPARIARVHAGARGLGELRRSGDPRWQITAREVLHHREILRRIGLSPAELHATAIGLPPRLAFYPLPILSLLALLGWAIGTAIFWIPYRLVGLTDSLMKPQPYVRATTKVLAGFVVFAVWIGLIAVAVGYYAGPVAAGSAAALLPLAGLATLRLREEWKDSRREARRFFLGRRRPERLAELRARQRALAFAIAELVDRDLVTLDMG